MVPKIMVIDDDAQLLHMLGVMLEREGHVPILLDDPRRAIELIKADPPDLLVLDVMMPAISGHDLAEEIRETDEISALPILILTARAQPIDRQAALESGADAYMSKPVTPPELLEQIDQLLTRREESTPGTQGMVISLFGMRGGVGRTTLATNLAAALRHTSQEEVCLIDLTPSGGQVVLHLRLHARTNWTDLTLSGLDWSRLEDRLLRHQSGLYVLAAPKQPQLPIAPSSELLIAILEILREHVAFAVLDLPPLLNPAVQTALSVSDMVLHVITPEVISVQIALQTTLALDYFRINLQHKAYILNQIRVEPQLPASAVEKGLRARVPFKVAYDPHQMRALAQGVPLVQTPAQSALPTTVRRLAETLWQRAH